MRVSYSFAVRDQNRLVYQRDEDFAASLPPELRGPMQRWYDRFQLSLDDYIALFEGLYRRHNNKSRVKIQLAPANLHWCSDEALGRLSDTSRKYGVPLHMHLLETAYQKEYARRRGGGSAVEHIDRFGLLGPQMTLGHGVWLARRTFIGWPRRAPASAQLLVQLPAALGVAALNVWRRGVNTAIGMDEAGINDDRDMPGDAHGAARPPGAQDEDDVPTRPRCSVWPPRAAPGPPRSAM